MPDDLDGLSEADLRARVRAAEEKAEQLEASAMYGDPAAIGGGEGGPGPRGRARSPKGDEAFLQDFAVRWNERTGVTKQEVDKYVRIIAGAHVARHLGEHSSTPGVRAALDPQRLRQAQEGR